MVMRVWHGNRPTPSHPCRSPAVGAATRAGCARVDRSGAAAQPDRQPARPSERRRTAEHTDPPKGLTMSRGAQRISVDLADTARRLSRQRSVWQGLVDFDPITRYYARLLADERHEAWLLTWLPGQ